ncbi:MAG: NAD(P)H-hydrate epimerase [Pseudotabrizicola sp.]|uniref:NAD(P)H-hydrate epimerase n=1 Tax=Pseudotabrizicola sp. TaxID=2939647 RepID=UPI002715B4BD|nr:NAD(P)H-hydrate epimerase [Pseudotabrizicola sp.]MDO9637418.1 NAD(P)H-hydrate epimerase [Pseudotabrizicola sp.]
MVELLTSAQMRAVEAAAIASGAVAGLELMERAGAGVVAAVMAEWPELVQGASPGALPRTPEYFNQDEGRQRRAVVLCGPGNNGGDGFVVARLLVELGWAVEVYFHGEAARLPPDARVNCERWCGMGEVVALTMAQIARRAGPVDLVVDAVFGTGLTRPVEGELAQVLATVWPGVARVVAVDVPTGLCADSGRVIGVPSAAVRADLTVSFHRAKVGHYLADGPGLAGRLVVADIGLGGRGDSCSVGLVGCDPAALRKGGGHKYAYGHALVLSGQAGHGGAGRLAARGALRIGAGVVTVACPPGAVAEHAARLEAVMLREVADAATLAAVLEDGRISSLCLGPGMGLDARAAGLVGVALAGGAAWRGDPRPTEGPASAGEGKEVGRGSPRRKLVLDADALTLIARDPALFAALHENCVLTPHAGEFARLFPDIAAKLAASASKGPACSKVDATREAAKRAGCTVLFKGPDTVIADPDGRCAISAAVYDRAAPWLATAGAGDVLAGFICGLLARGFAPFEAACTGAWLHVECARSFGPGLIAEDLPEELPKVLRALGVQAA